MFLRGWFLPLFFVIGFAILPIAHAQNSNSSYVKALYSLPLSLDPIKMNDTASLAVGNLIYDGLLKFSPSLKIGGRYSKNPGEKTSISPVIYLRTAAK